MKYDYQLQRISDSKGTGGSSVNMILLKLNRLIISYYRLMGYHFSELLMSSMKTELLSSFIGNPFLCIKNNCIINTIFQLNQKVMFGYTWNWFGFFKETWTKIAIKTLTPYSKTIWSIPLKTKRSFMLPDHT